MIPAKLGLWLAAALFSAAATAVVYLQGVDGTAGTAFSLWNLLALANLAFAVFGLIANRKQFRSLSPRDIKKSDWAVLAVLALISGGVAPAFLFKALSDHSVTGVIVLSRIEPPLTLFLAATLLGVQANGLRVCGAFLAFCGVLLTVMLQGPMGGLTKPGVMMIGTGELLAIGAGVLLAITTVGYKVRLAHVPVSVYVVARAFICGVFFLLVGAAVQEGSLSSAVSGAQTWPYLAGYVAVFGILAPVLWVVGMRNVHPATVSIAASSTPFLAVLIAAQALGQSPSLAEILGGSLVGLGVIMGIVGAWEDGRHGHNYPSLGACDEFDSTLGFKGI